MNSVYVPSKDDLFLKVYVRKQMDQRTKKLLTIHKALHSRDDVDGLYVSRKGEKGNSSIEDSIDASIQRSEFFIEKCGGRLITATRNNTYTRNNRKEIIKEIMGRKNNCIEVLSDKKATYHTRKTGWFLEKEMLRENLILF